MSDPPGLKYSPDEPMLLSLLLLLLFPRMSRIPQLRFSPRLDESGKSQANSKLARVNKQRSLQNALCFNGDWKTRQPSLSSSKNKINTLEAFLTVWHSFTIKYFFWCVFFLSRSDAILKSPFLHFLLHVIKLLHFQRTNTSFCPQTRRNVAGSQNGRHGRHVLFISPPLVFKPVKAYLPGNEQIMTTFSTQMTPALQSHTAAQMSRQPTREC